MSGLHQPPGRVTRVPGFSLSVDTKKTVARATFYRKFSAFTIDYLLEYLSWRFEDFLPVISYLMSNPSDLKYTREHEWISFSGDSATIGITDFAQSQLGDIVYIELPAVGKTFKKGDSFCVLESTKAASDVYAPVDFTVTAVNDSLVADSSPVNTDPYSSGWLIKVSGVSEGTVGDLLTLAEYEQFIAGQ